MIEAFRARRRAALGRLLPPCASPLPHAARPGPGRRHRTRDVGARPGDRSAGHAAATAVELALRSGAGRRGAVLRPRVALLRSARFPASARSRRRAGFPINTGGAYDAEDVTARCSASATALTGTGTWNFNADDEDGRADASPGREGTMVSPVFSDTDLLVARGGDRRVVAGAQSAACAPAAHPDHRRRTARARPLRIHRRERRARRHG